MPIKKTIAIVGATEKTGVEITDRFASMEEYRLLLVSNDINQLVQLAKNVSDSNPKAEIDSIECVKDGCWEADIIIVAVPFCEEKEVAEMIKEVATQKIVVIVSGEKNNDLHRILPYSKLVNVSDISTSEEIFISGSADAANEEILMIFEKAGYYPTLKESSPSGNSNHLI